MKNRLFVFLFPVIHCHDSKAIDAIKRRYSVRIFLIEIQSSHHLEILINSTFHSKREELFNSKRNSLHQAGQILTSRKLLKFKRRSDFSMIFIPLCKFFIPVNLCKNSDFLKLPIRRITDKGLDTSYAHIERIVTTLVLDFIRIVYHEQTC